MKYVIKHIPRSSIDAPEGYWTGGSYVVSEGTFYVFSEDLEKAKKYSSKKRAEKGIDAIERWNIMYNLVVEEVEE